MISNLSNGNRESNKYSIELKISDIVRWGYTCMAGGFQIIFGGILQIAKHYPSSHKSFIVLRHIDKISHAPIMWLWLLLKVLDCRPTNHLGFIKQCSLRLNHTV